MSNVQKISMRLQGYDYRILDKSVLEITEAARRTGARFCGPVPLPVKKEKFTVLRSPHIDKKARDQFEIRIHKRLIFIENCNPKTLEALMELKLASEIEVDIRV